MNKFVVLGIAVVLLAGLGATIALTGTDETSQQSNVTEQSEQPTASTTESESPQKATEINETQEQPSEQYVAYSDDTFVNTDGERLLFFHASWCIQCRQLEADILKNIESIPNDVTIFEVDYDQRQDLRQKYGVTLQTTIVKVDAEGNAVQNFIAYQEPTFQSLVDNIF